MLVKVTNSYHKTEELLSGDSLESIKASYMESIKWTANNLAENEVEKDWKKYYKTYQDAFDATYDGILEQLTSELNFEIITQNLTVQEVIDKLSELPEAAKQLPLYVSNEDGNNYEISSLSLFDESDSYSLENPLGLNFNTKMVPIINKRAKFENNLKIAINKFEKDINEKANELANKSSSTPKMVTSSDYLDLYELNLTLDCLTDSASIESIYDEFREYNLISKHQNDLSDVIYKFANLFKEFIIYDQDIEKPWNEITNDTLDQLDWSELKN